MAIPEYKLSTVLHGHSLDVRCVSVTKDECILSSSRDRSAKLWHPEGAKDFAAVVTYKGHTNFVSSVCFLPPCEAHPDGLVVTASNDTTICAYNIQDPIPVIILKGHENVVCNVSPGKIPGTILSASWDSTGRVWSVNILDAPILILKGHSAAVWAIIELGNQHIATGSADKSVIIWNKDGQKVEDLVGHTDCVRALAVANADSFFSCGNDASVRLWSNKGECLNTYFGHSNYIYSICVNPYLRDSCFVTCGEDSTVRVWLAGDNVCTLTLPAQSVWSVTCLSNGDIVAGSSDGLIRVFSADPIRYADDSTLKCFEQEVTKLQEASLQEIGGVKVTDLPGPEILFEPGKTDGQTKLVRKGTNVKCYSWSAAAQSWAELGDVTGAAGATEGKTLYQGKEYDFVFSVDVEDGKPPIKLPYNMGEDPWVSSQAFIHKNNLPQVYLEQVANFILKNSGQEATNITTTTGDYMDPFTGGSRYVPGSGSVGPGVAGQNSDPFTGASSYSTSAGKGQSLPTLFPQKTYLRFDHGNTSLILDKLKDFNQKSGCTILTNTDLEEIVKLADIKMEYSSEAVDKLRQIMNWPQDLLFPVLDVTRLAVRNPKTNADLFNKETSGHHFISLLLENLLPGRLAANQLLSLRVLTNAFAHLQGEMIVLEKYEDILNCLICLLDLNKNMQALSCLRITFQLEREECEECRLIAVIVTIVKNMLICFTMLPLVACTGCSATKVVMPIENIILIAASTLLLNFCVALGQLDDTTQLCNCVLQMVTRFLDNEAYFSFLTSLVEDMWTVQWDPKRQPERGLVALGTLIMESPSKLLITSMVVSNTLFMQQLKKKSSADGNADMNRQKIMTCAQQILQIL